MCKANWKQVKFYIYTVQHLLTSIHGPLAAQSRDDPEPYSLPAKIITGVFVLMYFWAASNTSIWTDAYNVIKEIIVMNLL